MRPIRRTHFEAHRGQGKGANQRKHQVLRETLVQRTFRKLAEKPGARRCRCSTHRCYIKRKLSLRCKYKHQRLAWVRVLISKYDKRKRRFEKRTLIWRCLFVSNKVALLRRTGITLTVNMRAVSLSFCWEGHRHALPLSVIRDEEKWNKL